MADVTSPELVPLFDGFLLFLGSPFFSTTGQKRDDFFAGLPIPAKVKSDSACLVAA